MVHLFAALPAADRVVDGQKIPVSCVHNCRRLSHEWQAYISRSHKLMKVFISVKGIYYQAEVEGQKITWLTPHALQQVLLEVDYKVLLTFLEFYEVEALAVQLTQREGELIQEKAEVKKLATFLKQASEDAKKLVDEERSFARTEIENARAAVQRVEEALQEHEQMLRASGKQVPIEFLHLD